MNIETLLMMGQSNQILKKEILSFDTLCDELSTLTEQENHGFLSGDRNLKVTTRKLKLLNFFEYEAPRIFNLLKEQAPHNHALHDFIIDKIQNLQDKLKVNTSLQVHAMSALQNKVTGGGDTQQCH